MLAKETTQLIEEVFNFHPFYIDLTVTMKNNPHPLRESKSTRYEVMCRPATFILFVR